MALPSAVTIGSLAFVTVAGVALIAVSSSASEPEAGPEAPRTSTPESTAAAARGKAPKATPDNEGGVTPDRPRPRVRKPLRPEVEIFNSTGVSGLAADMAADLVEDGWRVPVTDNWYGDIPADTVYFQPGDRAAAKALARTLGISRLQPADTPMNDERLTIIVAQS